MLISRAQLAKGELILARTVQVSSTLPTEEGGRCVALHDMGNQLLAVNMMPRGRR